MRKLTIGLTTFDDHDGVYFTIQAIRMFHPEALDDIEFLIIDNHPDSAHGKAVKALTGWVQEPIRYIPVPDARGPAAAKDLLFTLAETRYVLVADCHVLLAAGALRKLIDFFSRGDDAGNLLQGPLIYDDLKNFSTHFDFTHWGSGMWGKWATDERGRDPGAPPFPIDGNGMGLFACRRNAWLGFNPQFRGFGGEEGYIHEKFRQHGRTILCLPFLRWLHRFARPGGVPYPLSHEDRIRNYLIGHCELKLDPKPIADHFKELLGEAEWARIWAKLRPEFTPRCTPMPVEQTAS